MNNVRIETPNGDSYVFPCQRWLDTKEQDRKIERILYVEDLEKEVLSRKSPLVEFRNESRYDNDYTNNNEFPINESQSFKVYVTTSKKSRAGTDAKVFIKIYGTQASSERIDLDKSKRHRNPFESGNLDVFDVNVPYLGEITKIK